LYNKIEDNFHLNNKKALYINMKNYYEAIGQDVFDNLPLTFHIKTGLEDPEFNKFRNYYNKLEDDIKHKRKHKRKEAFDTKKVENEQE
jgi:tubulin monoglycylase TTLL3/8